MTKIGLVLQIKEIIYQTIVRTFRIIARMCTKGRIGWLWSDQILDQSFQKIINVSHNDVALVLCSPTELTGWRANTFSSKEPETLEWIDSFIPDSVLWDVGANIGLYSLYAAKKKRCHVYAFEPSVFNLELLARNIWLNNSVDNIAIVPLPLSSEIAENNLNMSSMAWGGALSTFGADYGHDGKPLNKIFEFRTFGISMDQVVDLLKISAPRYLKIDVDGIEHLILEGGPQVLSQVEQVLIEVNEQFIFQLDQVGELLHRAGLSLTTKRHSQMIQDSKWSNIYNQIWVRQT